MTVSARSGAGAGAGAGGIVLATLCAAQFLMALDSSVMNVSIASVAEDIGTTVTGVQTAITFYTLVMATLMITGGKLGAMFGRRRMFVIGTVIYACGSLTTALAPNLTVLMIGWSFLEGVGAALIMPAVVALVAVNVPPAGRTAAYGLIAAAAAMAVALGPIIGGFVTTSFSWRWVFAGEVVVAGGIILLARRIVDAPPESGVRLDLVGVALSIVGLGAIVFGFLKSSTWGWVNPKPGAPEIAGVSVVAWLIVGGALALLMLLRWLDHVERRGGEPLFRRGLLANRQLSGGLSLFWTQYFMQTGVFFTIPLFLSIVLGLSAFETGLRLLPLSAGLLITAVGIPRVRPDASPRRVGRLGLLCMLVGTVLLIGGLQEGADATIVLVPLLLIGLGIGALASQLGAVTVSAVEEREAAEVGGLQNTVMNLGASMGTALVGALLIGALSAALAAGIKANPDVPASVKSQAEVTLQSGIPFLSDEQLEAELEQAGVDAATADEIVQENATARYDGLRIALFAVVLIGLLGLFLSGRLPERAVAREGVPPPAG
jgi:MFS family permease